MFFNLYVANTKCFKNLAAGSKDILITVVEFGTGHVCLLDMLRTWEEASVDHWTRNCCISLSDYNYRNLKRFTRIHCMWKGILTAVWKIVFTWNYVKWVRRTACSSCDCTTAVCTTCSNRYIVDKVVSSIEAKHCIGSRNSTASNCTVVHKAGDSIKSKYCIP